MSKSIIFYFTGTGNSLKVAKDIQRIIGEECELVLIPSYKKDIVPSGYDRIGFIHPTYSGAPPLCVQRFVQNMDFSKNKDAYYFEVATYGGTSGNSFYYMSEMLTKKGISLKAVYGIGMNGNYIAAYNPWDIKEKKKIKIQENIHNIAEKIVNKEESKIPKCKNLIFDAMNKHMMPKYPEKDKAFNVSEDCIGCQICSKVCSVGNIKMIDGKPVFNHHCEQCMACIHACPKQALNYKNVTKKRNRYRNSEITLNELMNKTTI